MNLIAKKKQRRVFDNKSILNGKFILPNIFSNVFIMLVVFIAIFVKDVQSQLPDNGFRDDQYNNNGYNSGSVNQGSQTILEVVKSINYLSEVRKLISYFIFVNLKYYPQLILVYQYYPMLFQSSGAEFGSVSLEISIVTGELFALA